MGFIWNCIKVYPVIVIAAIFMYIVFTPSFIIFSVLFGIDISNLDQDMYYVNGISGLAVYFYAAGMVWESEYRNWMNLKYIFVTGTITAFTIFLANSFPHLFQEGAIFFVLQNGFFIVVTHLAPYLYYFDADEDKMVA